MLKCHPRFAGHTGAIIGVALSGTVALILMVFLIFFLCKRYRFKHSSSGSRENIFASSRHALWRPPLDGDADSYLAGYGNSTPPIYPGTLDTERQIGEAIGRVDSFGEHLSGEGGGNGSAESVNAGMILPMSPTFGGQPYLPGLGQALQGSMGVGESAALSSRPFANTGDMSQIWWGSNETHTTYNLSRQPIASDSHVSAGKSAVSLDYGTPSAGSSSGEEALSRTNTRRTSLPGPRPMPTSDRRRHSSTPATALAGSRDPNLDHERQQDTSDKVSVRFLDRLRSGRRISAQSVATIKSPPQMKGYQDSIGPQLNVYSPSLLNPPVPLPASLHILRFPRGVTGNPYNASVTPRQHQHQNAEFSPSFWPPATLPPCPSPVPTENSNLAEGLLHPRLGMALDHSQQASATSLRDHEDYTRPINGLVNNQPLEHYDFETRDTTESVDGIIS
ncbi:hypothetical protein B0H34DRAFT_675514 [Crassisporium funariophilum]|nr:hypothetical protein B0H34DRAFT_675514 [Crassisporium funariophilum]